MIRIASLAIAACALAGIAQAQASPWTFEGITFTQTEGWCPVLSEDTLADGTKVAALKIFSCGKEFPMLSAGIGLKGAAMQDMATLTTRSSTVSAGDEGKSTVDIIFQRRDKSCTRQTYAVDNNPVRNLPAYQVNATYSCPALGTGLFQFHNITAYAQRKNGDIWVVAFDSEVQAITPAEEELIRNAVAALNGK